MYKKNIIRAYNFTYIVVWIELQSYFVFVLLRNLSLYPIKYLHETYSSLAMEYMSVIAILNFEILHSSET